VVESVPPSTSTESGRTPVVLKTLSSRVARRLCWCVPAAPLARVGRHGLSSCAGASELAEPVVTAACAVRAGGRFVDRTALCSVLKRRADAVPLLPRRRYHHRCRSLSGGSCCGGVCSPPGFRDRASGIACRAPFDGGHDRSRDVGTRHGAGSRVADRDKDAIPIGVPAFCRCQGKPRHATSGHGLPLVAGDR